MTLRVMVMSKANKDSEAGIMPKEKLLDEMGKFNVDLVKAGVIQRSSKGKRVRFSGGKRRLRFARSLRRKTSVPS